MIFAAPANGPKTGDRKGRSRRNFRAKPNGPADRPAEEPIRAQE
jgi:hypothetical protein